MDMKEKLTAELTDAKLGKYETVVKKRCFKDYLQILRAECRV